MIRYLEKQIAWSKETFGPGVNTEGLLDHIAKELEEIRAEPHDLEEWVDVLILAFDGAWRAGYSPDEILEMLERKQYKNIARTWPDWRTAPPGKAIEHIDSTDSGEGNG